MVDEAEKSGRWYGSATAVAQTLYFCEAAQKRARQRPAPSPDQVCRFGHRCSSPPRLPATGPQPGRLCMPHRAGLTFLTSGRSAALSAVSRGDFCHRPKTRPFERLSCQEPAVGNSPAERRLWRSPTSRRDPTARPVRTSSGSPRSLVPQATLRLYGVAHGSRRAAAARGARARPDDHLANRTRRSSEAGARHAPVAEGFFASPQRVQAPSSRVARIVNGAPRLQGTEENRRVGSSASMLRTWRNGNIRRELSHG